ncbi:MAG: ABC transporter ATP-binding protein [Acidimicrobiales bacterium]|jgi:branched-chain amino acid transport system ATP-binding protein|nr:ABC transporter ATP-binding protein [Acidimicrobiales bacterium]MDP6886816.1 ABC transporter ATP-binding protein [SAR324 cluster bacterium]RZO40885.1 MAG: ABC transporter ATP-binding protein [Pseudomonadota bacterium]|tara:strand:- start:1296 stop:2012 length:717 start_codon:yes stop_codon:yes gene_type:complete
MLRTEKITTFYGEIQALNGLTLEARKGEVTCVLGPNGAGKTTTMFTIAGILKSRSGSIFLEDQELTRESAQQIVRKGIALVPENRLIFPQMSIKENLYAGAFSRSSNDPSIENDILKMYQRFPRLEERRKQLAGTLSGGEQQMLAIARALMAQPKILLMDEPSLGLAPLVVKEIFTIIRQLNEEGVTILLVEQNARMALKVAHKVYLLEQGKVSFSGSPEEIHQDEAIKRAYLGTEIS